MKSIRIMHTLCSSQITVADNHGSFIKKQLHSSAPIRRRTRSRTRSRSRRCSRTIRNSAGKLPSSHICTDSPLHKTLLHLGNVVLSKKKFENVIWEQTRKTLPVSERMDKEEEDEEEDDDDDDDEGSAKEKGKGTGNEKGRKDEEEVDEIMEKQELIKHLLSSHHDGMDALEHGRSTHAIAIKHGLMHEVAISNALITMYGRHGHICDARIIFEKASDLTVISWTAMIHAYSHNGYHSEALRLFREMESLTNVKPNEVTFATIIRSCAAVPALVDGRSIHLKVVENGFEYDVFVGTSLIDMYGKSGSLEEARFMFDRMPRRNLATWNSILTAYAHQQKYAWHALEVFRMMLLEGVGTDKITFISLINACSCVGSLKDGYVIHEYVVGAGIENDVVIRTSLVDMYSKCGDLEEARSTFEEMCERTVVTWNALLGAYSNNYRGREEEALHLFMEMQQEGVMPDEVTFINMLHSCKNSLKGRELHASIRSNTSTMLETALVCMYGKLGDTENAQDVFDNMCSRDLICWTTMITAYIEKGESRNALRIFRLLEKEKIKPDEVCFVGILTACANLTSLNDGREVHMQVVESGLESKLFISNALLNMYGKCGSLDDAQTKFERSEHRNLVTWNTIIAACAQQGSAKEALRLFGQMEKEMIVPDQVTFVSILSACVHEALLEEGRDCFETMILDFGIFPSIEHYGCMVDLLSRFGKLDEAEDLIFSMPIVPDGRVWNTLLGACKAPKDDIRGWFATKHIMTLEPQDATPYISLSSMYAEHGRWDMVEI